MIDHLKRMAIFARVIESGSFRAAAADLNLAPSRVSQTVSDLEAHLGVTLLYRSTRQISLTDEGEILYAQTRIMLDAAERGLEDINLRSREPFGELKIAAPAFLTKTSLMDHFAGFRQTYPRIALKMNFSDRPRDLLQDGFDVAIRAGCIINDEMFAQNIGGTDRFLVASPDYVARHSAPADPGDLEHWDWIRYDMRPDRTDFTSSTGKTMAVWGQSSVWVDSVDALYELAIRSLGLTPLPDHIALRGLKSGELVHVLPEWSLAPLQFHAIWPDSSRRKSISLILVDFLAAKAKKEASPG